MIKFREILPVRSCKEVYNDYRKYKPYLKEDFASSCGYSGCSDFWFGGSTSFHIDHFMPKSKYSELKSDYSNLVYACSYVNILKSDDDGSYYLDPCNEDLNAHFYRDENGVIYPFEHSRKAQYTYKRLKLYLSRYSIIWKLDKLRNLNKKLFEIKKTLSNQTDLNELNALIADLSEEFSNYLDYLQAEQM